MLHAVFNVDTKLFSALTQAIFILKCLSYGQTKHQIVYGKFNGDMQLVSIWVNFLKEMGWLKENTEGQLEITEEGKTWISKCHFVIR
jgi:predicted transcriptional regulator